MKSEIVGGLTQEKEHDWSKPCLVYSKGGVVILTDSNTPRDKSLFSGMVISLGNNLINHVGHYSSTWSKSAFTPITKPLTIKFTP